MKNISAIVSCYKGEKYLGDFLKNVVRQTVRNELEIVLVHNEPSQAEIRIVKDFEGKYPGLLNHIVVPREKLAVSTNRAMKAAAGKYLCIWNIDDLRTENSLELMFQTMEQNKNIGFTYGDYIIVNKWLKKEGKLIIEPEFEKQEFIRSMHLGPFYMWKKELCNTLGFWDEQCLQGADYEYAVRLAAEAEGKKTPGVLGYYLDEGLGLSTKRATFQPIERTFIELRFGAFRKIDFWYLSRARKYNIDQVLEGEKWIPIDSLSPNRKKYMDSNIYWLFAIARYPFWVLQRVINKIKRKFL